MHVLLRLSAIALLSLLFGCGIGLQAVAPSDAVIPDDDDDATGDDDDSAGDDDDATGDDDDDDATGDDDDATGDDDDAAGGAACTAVTTLTCDQQLSADTTDPGATNSIDEWGCTGWANTGPELAYEFSPPEDMDVTVSFQSMEEGQDLDLYVTADSGIGCHSADCIAAGDNDATWSAYFGSTYYVLVDGYQGAAGSFVLDVDCTAVSGDDDDSVGDDDDSVGDDDDSTGGSTGAYALPCSSTVLNWDIYEVFGAGSGDTVFVSIDTISASTTFDPWLVFMDNGTSDPATSTMNTYDDEFTCTFPPPSYSCPEGDEVVPSGGLYFAVGHASDNCAGSSAAYSIDMTVNGGANNDYFLYVDDYQSP